MTTGRAAPTAEPGPIRSEVRGPALPARVADLTGETLVSLLERAVDRSPAETVFVVPRAAELEQWTFRDLLERSERVARALRRHGVKSGDRILTLAGNDPWLAAAYFAIWRLGAVIVPLDLRMAQDVVLRICARTRPTLVLAGLEVPHGQVHALGVPVLGVSAEGLCGDARDDGTGTAGDALPDPPSPDALCEILYTSGTTGDPKGVALTHRQMVHNVRAITHSAGMRRERALALIPLSHMYGQMVPLLYGLVSGSQITFLAKVSPEDLLEALQRDRITAITTVPALLALMLHRIESEAGRQGRLGRLRRARTIALRLPFPLRRLLFRSVHKRLGGSLELFSSGGAKLPVDVQQAWEGMGIHVVQGYGATECATIASHTRRSRRPGTVGLPMAEMTVRIGPDGELLARGPCMMEGYWEDPTATARAIVDGWAHTGDEAAIDRHGEIVILGRTNDRIVLPNGLKVYPEDVEDALVRYGGVKAAVVLEASPGRLAAVLVPHQPDTADEELGAAVRRANATLAPHQRVRRWRRWPEEDLPRTHTLKIRRRIVAEWFARTDGADGVDA